MHHASEEDKYMLQKDYLWQKGISLNIGLNSVDPNHYGGWDGQLRWMRI